MKTFAKIMALIGILILLGTSAIFVLSIRGIIAIDKSHVQSVVFCTLGLAFLCYVPSKIVVLDEAKKMDEDQKGVAAAEMALVLNVSAGLILVGLSLRKYFMA